MLTRLVLAISLLMVSTPAPAHAEPDIVDLQAITKPGHIDPNNPDQMLLYMKIRNNGPGVAATGNWSWEIKLPSGMQSTLGCTIYTPGTHFACNGSGFHYPVGHALADDTWWIIKVQPTAQPLGIDGFFKLIHNNDPNHSNDVAPLTISMPTSAAPTPTKTKPTSLSPSPPTDNPEKASPTFPAADTPTPLASASAGPSSTLPSTPVQTQSMTDHIRASGTDGGLILTTLGVATGSTALLASIGFFIMRRRRDMTEQPLHKT